MSTHPSDMRTPLGRVRGFGAARSGTTDFIRQRLTAIANIPLTLGALAIVMWLIGANHATAKTMLGSPLIAIVMLLFLISVFWHMKIGMQAIIEDYVHEPWTKYVLLILNAFYTFAAGLAAVYAILKLSFGV